MEPGNFSEFRARTRSTRWFAYSPCCMVLNMAVNPATLVLPTGWIQEGWIRKPRPLPGSSTRYTYLQPANQSINQPINHSNNPPLEVFVGYNSKSISPSLTFPKTIFHNFRLNAGFQNYLPDFPGLLPKSIFFTCQTKSLF